MRARVALALVVCVGCTEPRAEPISIPTPSAAAPAPSAVSKRLPGAAADGTCSIVGELLPPGLTRTSGGEPKRRFTYRNGRMIEVVHEEERGQARVEELSYDERGWLSRVREGRRDGFHAVAEMADAMSYSYRESDEKVLITEVRAVGETVECALDRSKLELRCGGHGAEVGPWSSLRRFDATGRLLSDSADYQNSNGADNALVRTYDDASRVVRETRDFDNDGKIDREDAVTYDDAGRVIHVRTRGSTAGSKLATWEVSTSYQFDAAGRVACATTTSSTQVDGEPPTRSRETICNAYDAAGNLVMTTRASDHASEASTFEGAFRNMRCGRFPRPDGPDDADTTEWRQVWDEQIKSMLRK